MKLEELSDNVTTHLVAKSKINVMHALEKRLSFSLWQVTVRDAGRPCNCSCLHEITLFRG